MNVLPTEGISQGEINGTSITMGKGTTDAFMSGCTAQLDPNTIGYGMTFLHELAHTSLGFGVGDPGSGDWKGQVVVYVNTI